MNTMFRHTTTNLSKNNNKNIEINKKNDLAYFFGQSTSRNDCSSKIASFNPSKLSSPNLFMSNLKFRMKHYGCNNTLSHDVLSI